MRTGSRRIQPFLFFLVASLAAPAVQGRESPAAGNLLGQRGVLRLGAATPLPAGTIGIGTDFQYFSASGLLAAGQQHSRMVNTYAINWAPFRFIEGAFALHVTSDSSQAGSVEELQVAVGDPELSLKGGYEIGGGFSVGGLFDLRFPAGAGFFQSAASAVNVTVALLGSWFGGGRLPLGVHLNLGFLRDGSESLFEDPGVLSPAQRYAAQVSSFNRVVTRFAVEYLTTYVGPFLELSYEPFVGSGAPGASKSPGFLSLGLRGWPTRQKGLQLLAAMDVGISGVGDGAPSVDGGKYAFVVPRWNLLLQASYRFDPFAGPETRVIEKREEDRPPPVPPTGVIGGKVLDVRTERPIWNARVSVEGEAVSQLTVNPGDGSFRTYRVPGGKRRVVATAEGYDPGRQEVEVQADRSASVIFRLVPRTSVVPGTLRGTIKAMAGKLSTATVLIPEIDQTIAVDGDGSFTVSLKPGEYKIVVSAKGFRTQTKSIRIQEGSTVILNVDLYR